MQNLESERSREFDYVEICRHYNLNFEEHAKNEVTLKRFVEIGRLTVKKQSKKYIATADKYGQCCAQSCVEDKKSKVQKKFRPQCNFCFLQHNKRALHRMGKGCALLVLFECEVDARRELKTRDPG